MNPLVSVVIAVYNGEKYLSETLDSLIDQTLTDWECWIVDDGSTDSTLKILNEYYTKDSRFNIVKTEGGNGPYVCANIAIPFCRSEFIARIDADDLALPERLMMQYVLMIDHPEVNLCGSYFYYLNEKGHLTQKDFETDLLFLKWQIIFRNRLVHSTMMIRKSWFVEVGMYPQKRLAQDWYLWVKALSQECLEIIRHPLVKWRMHEQSITKNESGFQLRLGAEVSQYAVKMLIGKDSKQEYLFPITSALKGLSVNDSKVVEASLHELILLWREFKNINKLTKKQADLLQNEFIYFGFYLLTVNSKITGNTIKLLSLLCKTEFTFTSFIWILKYFKRKLMCSDLKHNRRPSQPQENIN